MRSILRTLTAVTASAVAVNYPWEMLQSHLYRMNPSSTPMWWRCFTASLGDTILVLVLLAVGWAWRHGLDWFEQPSAKDTIALIGAGALLGTAVEWFSVHVLGRWSYRPEMPLVPGLKIGIVPIVQMALLPSFIFQVAAVWVRRGRNPTS